MLPLHHLESRVPAGIYKRSYTNIQERLFARVVKDGFDGCWIWQGSAARMGHGQIFNGGFHKDTSPRKKLQVHRVTYELCFGAIPEGMCVCHKCDVPRCVNPAHLFLGTKFENSKDMQSKGRMKVGSALPQAKLHEDQVREIRGSSDTYEALALRFGVSSSHISNIKNRKNWAHVV